MRLALALAALVVASPVIGAPRPDGLLHEEALANEACRDGTGEHATAAACELRDIIDRSPCGDLTFLVTQFGKPFSVAGFGNWFRDRCNEAGLKGIAAHGVRKALLTMGAEDSLTDRELMAIAGHSTSKETTRYTQKAERAVMARSGMEKFGKGPLGNKSVPLENGLPKSGTNRPKN